MSDWLSRFMENGSATWYLTVGLIANCIGILGSTAILYRTYKYISARLLQRRKRQYHTGITTGEYVDWECRTLQGIYQSDEAKGCLGSFEKQGERCYPVIVKTGADCVKFNREKDQFDGFITEKDSGEIDCELLYKRLPQYRRFRAIVSDQVRFPELYGYTNTSFLFDEDKVYGFRARPRTYKETVFSCHVLQYELWRAFRKKKRLAALLRCKTIPAARLKDLPLRELIHNGKRVTVTKKGKQYDVLKRNKTTDGESAEQSAEQKAERLYKKVVFEGLNRSSLCDVNLVILKKTNPKSKGEDSNDWSAAVGRRSENVATFPGYWSIVPSGSFEMSEKTITPRNRKNDLFAAKLKKNMNVAYALYREYLEEVFNLSGYEHPNGDNDMCQLRNNEHIMALKNNEKVDLIFLGVCFNLIVLRQTISFALVVRDDSLLQNVRHNNENSILDFVSLKELEQIVADEDAVMPEFAGTYRLLMDNEYIQKEIAQQENSSSDTQG